MPGSNGSPDGEGNCSNGDPSTSLDVDAKNESSGYYVSAPSPSFTLPLPPFVEHFLEEFHKLNSIQEKNQQQLEEFDLMQQTLACFASHPRLLDHPHLRDVQHLLPNGTVVPSTVNLQTNTTILSLATSPLPPSTPNTNLYTPEHNTVYSNSDRLADSTNKNKIPSLSSANPTDTPAIRSEILPRIVNHPYTGNQNTLSTVITNQFSDSTCKNTTTTTNASDLRSLIIPPSTQSRRSILQDEFPIQTLKQYVHEQDSLHRDMNSKAVLFAYPFPFKSDEIHQKTSRLGALSFQFPRSKEASLKHYIDPLKKNIVIRHEDYERLMDGKCLNDSLVDLWMKWISREIDEQHHRLLIFNAKLYDQINTLGVKAVLSWTSSKRNEDINIFEKTFIFVPIQKHLHWSLCVILNPCNIVKLNISNKTNCDPTDKPCILLFDSKKLHNTQAIRSKLIEWLDAEWNKNNLTPINPFSNAGKKIAIYCPEGKSVANSKTSSILCTHRS